MQTPDFAQLGHPPLPARDLNFLFERFPGKIDVARAITEVGQFFNTLDSMLDADYVYAALRDADTLDLPVSPQLWFEVMLRNALPGRRNRQEQQALHYIAHLLALFSRAEQTGAFELEQVARSMELELKRVTPVNYFGEMAILDDEPRSAGVQVTKDSRLLVLKGEQLKDLVLQMPEIAFEIFKVLTSRIRQADDRLRNLQPKAN